MTESEFVVVHTASNFVEANLVAGLLKSEGIAAMVPGGELMDEFGMAQRLAGGGGDVVVRREHLERAQDIVAAWKEAPPS